MFSKSNLKRVFLCECYTKRTERLLLDEAYVEWAACRLAVLFESKEGKSKKRKADKPKTGYAKSRTSRKTGKQR